MGIWEFNRADASDVRQEITQADQFNNDDVELPEALVREAVQNSTDARATNAVGPVKVRFAIKKLSNEESARLRNQLADVTPHMEASKLDTNSLANENRVLAIEDFNTQGLTGEISELDGNGHFELFWRAMGQSAKSGKHGGRWGLGKLTYALSSKARIFYGLTVREGENQSVLMGQAVLRNHKIGDFRYKPHGFWFKERGGSEGIQLPVDDADEIADFCSLMGVQREVQTGLSVIIPFLRDIITEECIVSALMSNYFFPILSGRLEAEVGDTEVTAATFMKLAEQYREHLPSALPVRFVKAVSEKVDQAPDFEITKPVNLTGVSEETFDEDALEELRKKYREGENVHIRVPLVLTRQDGSEEQTYIDTFMETLGEKETPYTLIARNSILLKSEQKVFSGRQAHAALVATDDPLTEFLGDAENPAHTQWTLNAEKAQQNWLGVRENILAVRSILPDMHSVIAEQEEEKDENLLLDFFSIVEQAQKTAGRKPKTPKPKPELEPVKKAILIRKSGAGFELKSGPGTQDWTFPCKIRIRVAYDLIGSNPFKSHSKFDFDLKNPGTISWVSDNGSLTVLDKNIVAFEVEDADFFLRFDGFDVNRDLIVDARAV